MNQEYLECSCYSPEHTLKFVFDDDPDFPSLYAYVFLSEEVWYRRLWKALKYAMGYKCRYGHFDEFIMKHDDCDRLMSLIQRYKDSLNVENLVRKYQHENDEK